MTTTASAYGDLRHLLPNNYKALISAWLEEDCPSLDYGGFVVGESEAEAKLLGKSKGIVAGIPFVDEVFAQLGCSITWHIPESHPLPANSHPTHCATVRGPIRKILLGERVALNLLARCSGIATKSHALASALRAHGWQGTLAGTRKTTPGFRVVEKYGMLVGGADPHRHDLSHMVMLKDNHVWACANNAGGGGGGGGTATGATAATAAGDDVAGAIPRAVAAAKAVGGFATKIEVECRSIEEANAAIGAGAEVVMLDNFSAEGVRAAARQLKEEWRGKAAFLIEVSGGLTEENAAAFTCPDVDVLSTSSIHQGVAIIDFSLKVSLR